MLVSDYGVDIRTDLVSLAPGDGTIIISNGNSTRADAAPLFYYYDAASTATDNGDTVIKPTAVGVGAGRWLKRHWSYNDLADLPSLFSGAYNDLSGKPSLAAVATSGAYADLSGTPSIPTVKTILTYSGTTDASGNYTIAYGTAFSVTPDIQPQLQGGSNTQLIKIASTTASGFTVNVENRTDTLGLLPSYAAVSGASVGVLVTER